MHIPKVIIIRRENRNIFLEKRSDTYHGPAEVIIQELDNQAFREFFQDFLVDVLGAHSLEFCMALHEP